MITRATMGTIRRPLDYGDEGNETTDFIQFINGWEPQINKLWRLGLDGNYREVHPTAHVETLARTIREFVTNYLAEKGSLIAIIEELSINGSVQFLGLSNKAWRSGLPYITNHLDQVEATG